MVALALLVLAPAQWEPLFNGKNLDDFVKLGGPATYRLDGAEIVGTTGDGGPNTFLCTKRRFADFELEFDVKVDDGLNSGVQIRSNSVPGYRDGVVHGYQVEIDPANGQSAGIYDESRRGWLYDPKTNPKTPRAFKNQAWNHYRVVMKGPRIQTWLNGRAISDLSDDVTTNGFVGLQVHGVAKGAPTMEVRWKNLRVKDLGDPNAAPPKGASWLLRDQKDLDANWQAVRGGPVKWEWNDGAMMTNRTGDVRTKVAMGKCRIHLEFMTDENGLAGQANGNSGAYIQQRYEVQILNSVPRGPLHNECGGIYTIKAPDFAMARRAYEWQSYDIWFTPATWDGAKKLSDARITVYHNGTKIHGDIALPHATAAGEAEAPGDGALRLQDHGNKVKYRNVWWQPLK